MNIILSIKPKYAEAILNGTKKCEFRKAPLPEGVEHVIIYSSNGEGKIVGWFTVKKQVTSSPNQIWKRYRNVGGITRREFLNYYNGSERAICIEIRKIKRLTHPIDPYENIPQFHPPQSFRYLKENDYDCFIDRIPELRANSLRGY